MNISKWFAIECMWIALVGLLAYTVAVTGNLHWPVIFIPAVITFAAIGGDSKKKE